MAFEPDKELRAQKRARWERLSARFTQVIQDIIAEEGGLTSSEIQGLMEAALMKMVITGVRFSS